MEWEEWDVIYEAILDEMGYSRIQDEASARMLRHIMMNKDLIDVEELRPLLQGSVNVIGAAATTDEISALAGPIICAGSAATAMVGASMLPDILVTDLDGDIEDQLSCCDRGSVAVIHAHGDNDHLIQAHAHRFNCPTILTTQSRPDTIVMNFGGFTDGDRAVCLARYLGAKEIRLVGFDFDNPVTDANEDSGIKAKKLSWARRIIQDYNPPSVRLVQM